MTEVSVSGNNDASLAGCIGEDGFVARVLDASVAHVRCVVSCPAQRNSHFGRESVVDEELQSATRRGSSRSRTASAA